MKAKLNSLKISRVVILGVIAIVSSFIVSLSAYAVSPDTDLNSSKTTVNSVNTASSDQQSNDKSNYVQDAQEANALNSINVDPESTVKSSINGTQVLPQQNQDILNTSYPEKFDLRNVNGKNYVTPVKLQNP